MTRNQTAPKGSHPPRQGPRSQLVPCADRQRRPLDRFLASLGQGFPATVERRARIGEAQRLAALSDAELAKLGIPRDRIAHHLCRGPVRP